MFAKKSIFRAFSVLFVTASLLALVGPAHAAPASLGEPVAVCPPSIGFGETIQCSIDSAGETDTYTFTASAGDKVLVMMSTSSGSLWEGIRVYSPEGTKLCQAPDSNPAEIASCTLPSAGTYSILAYDASTSGFTGDYYLYLQRLNNPGSPVPIAFGQTLAGSIITPAEMDTYTFTASAGDKVLVRMGKPTGTLAPAIRVYSPDGTRLCEAHSGIVAEIASCTLPSAGTYSILAYAYYGTDTGNYYLYLQRLNNPGSPVPIAFGQTLSGSILTAAEMDTYTFTASAGDKVLVMMSTSSGSLWEGIRVYSPDGTKLCQAPDSNPAEIASCTLPSAGTYSILAYDASTSGFTGDYYLYLQRLNNPGSPVPIAFGQTLAGSIITPAEMDTYTFTASAGDKVLVRMGKPTGTLAPAIRVYSPDGTRLCEAHSGIVAEIASCTLPSAGTYSILAYAYYGTDTGNYYLYLQRLNNPGSPVPIAFGQTLSGSILTPAEMDTYTFTASAGDKVLVMMSTSSGSLWEGIRIYSPDGTKLCQAPDSNPAEIASCTLPSAGTYSILAYDASTSGFTGDYYLYLQRLNNPGSPVSIAFGQTLAGSIITPAEMDTYTFTASAGDKVLVRMGKPTGTLAPAIRVYSPDGTRLCEAHSGIVAEIASCTLPSAGTYSILAYAYYGTDTGNYYIYLQRLNNPGSPVPIAFGQTLSGSILTAAEMDTYTFTASAGDKVLVRMSTSSGSLWEGIRVYSPDGTKLCEASTEIASCTLTSAGTYSILAYDDFNGTLTGNYHLYLQWLNNPNGPVSISGNAGVAGATLRYMDGVAKTVITNGTGSYSLTVPSGWSGTVTPSKTGVIFTPASRSYTNVTANKTDQNYSATLTFTSTGAYDGWVRESTETSNVGNAINSTGNIYLGDSALRQQYRGILSFSTGATLPDTAVITGITLKVMKQNIVGGGNPVTTFRGFMVDIKNGLFGTAALQTTDFQTAASKTYGPFTTALSGAWYNINLTPGKAYINKLTTGSGLTQIRLRFNLGDNNNAIANYLSLYSGNATAANRPQLVITYYAP
jgi:hypothetical protein